MIKHESDLTIPERAYQACWDQPGSEQTVQEAERFQDALKVAAPIIVAEELRRIAKKFWDEDDIDAARYLANRANEVDPAIETWPGGRSFDKPPTIPRGCTCTWAGTSYDHGKVNEICPHHGTGCASNPRDSEEPYNGITEDE